MNLTNERKDLFLIFTLVLLFILALGYRLNRIFLEQNHAEPIETIIPR